MIQPHTRKIDDIQLLRAFAIGSVLFCHLSISATILASSPFHVSNPFYAGVELFFIISGYVVTCSLRRGHYRAPEFLIRRAFRLYPPILVFLLVTAIINNAIRMIGHPRYALQAFSVPFGEFAQQGSAIVGGYLINLGGHVSYMNSAMWSLSVEFQFYAFFAAFALGLGWLKFDMRLKDICAITTALIVLIIGVSARVLVGTGLSNVTNYLIAYKFDFMALGVVLAYLPLSRLRSVPARLGAAVGLLFLCVPVAILALCRSPFEVPPAFADSLEGFGMLATLACFGGLVLLGAAGQLSRNSSRRMARVILAMGDRSYTIYLLHFPCMVAGWILLVLMAPATWTLNRWAYAFAQPVATALLLVPLVELSYRYVELPWNAVGPVAAGRVRAACVDLAARRRAVRPPAPSPERDSFERQPRTAGGVWGRGFVPTFLGTRLGDAGCLPPDRRPPMR
jgi:peptidoglycan/LPS O-acetylase OafA/YrhL